MDKALADLTQQTMEYALKQGANQTAVQVSRAQFLDLKRREEKVETLQASTSRGLSLALYVDGRYSSNSTSFLEPEEVRQFVDRSLAMTRALAPDPHRALPDPQLYGPTTGVDLDLVDPTYDDLDMDRRLEMVAQVEQAASSPAVISVTAGMTNQTSESLQIHSNGFSGERQGTSFYLGAVVTVQDKDDDRRPEDHWYTGARHLEDLPGPEAIGQEAARRALTHLGSAKVDSGCMTMVLENRAAARLVASLLDPLYGMSLQQRRSCFEDKLGQAVASARLNIHDDPLLVRGLGSRTFDGEGLAAKRLPVVTAGELENYFIDVYYGRKLGRPCTTGSPSNLVLEPGTSSLEQLLQQVEQGILVTGFLGGNANPATGDFSFGISGEQIKDGRLVQPVSEMNITGNHLQIWQGLAAVGNDPYPYSSWSIPSLLLQDIQFSGM